MPAIILSKKAEVDANNLAAAKSAINKKSYPLDLLTIDLPGYELLVWAKQGEISEKTFKTEQNDCYAFTGFLIYKGCVGQKALIKIDEDLKKGIPVTSLKLDGTYFLVIFKNNSLYVLRDLFGGYAGYFDDSRSWITSNYLAAVLLKGELKFNKQEILEYVFFGLEFGQKTVVEGIERLKGSRVYNLTEAEEKVREIEIPSLEKNYEKCLQQSVDVLTQVFEAYKQVGEGKVTSALTGGFDSRLMLVLLMKVGIDPNLFVYGKESDEDVRTAKLICEAEGLTLNHTDKYKLTIPEPRVNVEWLFQKTIDLDGSVNPFVAEVDLFTREERAKNFDLFLNGAGGGIYRNNWRWDFSKVRVRDLFMNSYNTGELEKFGINVKEFFTTIESKIVDQFADVLGKKNIVNRQEAEAVFIIFRANFYYGGNAINNNFGNATLPFLSSSIVLNSFSVPFDFKKVGRFEADLIKEINSRIASYPSAYGFNFSDGPNFSARIKEALYSKVPPYLKSKLKKYSGLSRKSAFRKAANNKGFVKQQEIEKLIKSEGNEIKGMIPNVELIQNPNILGQISTLEVLSKFYREFK